MEHLNLPRIREAGPPPKRLSMDDYLKFVQFNLKHTVDLKAARERKRRCAVNARFHK